MSTMLEDEQQRRIAAATDIQKVLRGFNVRKTSGTKPSYKDTLIAKRGATKQIFNAMKLNGLKDADFMALAKFEMTLSL